MKNILIALSLTTLISCGKDADVIKAENSKFPTLVRQNLEVDYSNIDEEIKSGTVLVYPKAEDVVNYSYTFDPEIYSKVIGSVVGATGRVPPSIPMGMPANIKVAAIVKVIQLVGIARDNAQVKIVNNEKTLSSIMQEIEPLFEAYPCFKVKSGINEGKCVKERITSGENKTERRAEKYRSCADLSVVVGTYIDMTDDELAALARDAEKCESVEQGRIAGLNEDSANQRIIRDYGKALFLDMMGSLEKSSGNLYRFVFAGSEDDYDDISRISFSYDGKKIEQLSLFIDFNLGTSFKTYSLEEGNLKVIQFIDDPSTNTKMLEIEIKTGRFLVRSKLYMSSVAVFGVRLVGEADFYFPNKRSWKGVIRMDLEEKSK